jgi:hypothetical protein
MKVSTDLGGRVGDVLPPYRDQQEKERLKISGLDAARSTNSFSVLQDMFCQALAQPNDCQNRGPCQCFRKNTGIANIQFLDLGLQVFIHQRPNANGSAGMCTTQRRGKDRFRPSARFH